MTVYPNDRFHTEDRKQRTPDESRTSALYIPRQVSIYLSIPSLPSAIPRNHRAQAPTSGRAARGTGMWIIITVDPDLQAQAWLRLASGLRSDRLSAMAVTESGPEGSPDQRMIRQARRSSTIWDEGAGVFGLDVCCWYTCMYVMSGASGVLALLIRYVLYVQIQHCLNRAGWIRTRVSGRYYSSFVFGCFSLRGQRAGSLCVYPVGCLSVELCPVLLLYTCPVLFLSMGLGL